MPIHPRGTRTPQKLSSSLALLIILVAAWFRLWQLPHIPPGLEYDEAFNGLDALWMLEQGQPYLFVLSNNGREALFLYPAALFIHLLGTTPLALRLTSALVGILAVPLIYRLAGELFRFTPHRRWVALLAAAGLAVSLWHVSMSRVAFRAIFIPTFLTLLALLFWRGWRKDSWRYFAAAGLVLGASQYSYLSARLFPLALLLFGAGVWLAHQFGYRSKSYALPSLLKGLLLTGLVSAVLFMPLGFFFWQHPAALTGRADQIIIPVKAGLAGAAELLNQAGAALTIFVGGGDPRIRHHPVGWPLFSPVTLLGFWAGLVVMARRWYKPENMFLGLSLIVMLLPGVLSVDPVHNLRTAGILPAVYIIAAVGWTQLALVGLRRWRPTWPETTVGLGTLLVVLAAGGLLTGYLYFGLWANDRRVYEEYNGPMLDLADYAADLTQTAEVIVPYEFYAYPPVRYVLHHAFPETLPPVAPTGQPGDNRPLFLLNQPQWVSPPYIRLSRDQTGAGHAYPTAAPPAFNPATSSPVLGRQGAPIAVSQPLDRSMPAGFRQPEPVRPTPFVWGSRAHLAGYALAEPVIRAGQAGRLTLWWADLPEELLAYNTFIQLVNGRGEPVSQLEESLVFHSRLYYENRVGLARREHLFWIGPETPPGLYLLRLGLFNPKTGERLPVNTAGQPLGDQLILTPFYVAGAETADPRRPEILLKAGLGDTIQLLGYSISRPAEDVAVVKLYWQATGPVNADYTVTLQLLGAQQQVLAQQDKQPLAGLYPTSRWQPGQVIVDEFTLSLSGAAATAGSRLVTGMYDLVTGVRLPAYAANGEPYPDGLIVLEDNQ